MIVHRSMQVYEVVDRADWLRGVIRGTTFEDWRWAGLHDERVSFAGGRERSRSRAIDRTRGLKRVKSHGDNYSGGRGGRGGRDGRDGIWSSSSQW